jgi:hypothetical protein
MLPNEKELREILRLGIKTLIIQEVRLLQLEQNFTPHIVIDEVSQSIQDTKREIIKLTKGLNNKERTVLLRRKIREAVDEEIDRAIQLRENKCVRCIHGRFYDKSGTVYTNLPIGIQRVQTIGCDKLQLSLKKGCRQFVETSMAISLEDYLNEMTFLYEFREMIGKINEIFKDYFFNP